MKPVSTKRDEVGVFSDKNSVSKYWGVTLAKKETGYTVRFFDKVNQETIMFKPKNFLTEAVAATIAARFYDARELYSITTAFNVQIGDELYLVNNCKNTIELVVGDQEIPQVELKSEGVLPHISNHMVNQRKTKEVQQEVDRPVVSQSKGYSDFDFLGYEPGTMYFELTEKGYEIPPRPSK